MNSPIDMTIHLRRFVEGEAVSDEFMDRLYGELHSLAGAQLGVDHRNHTLTPTVLVHEAWMKLIDQSTLQVDGRSQFFALASRVIRSVMVDHHRAQATKKRGRDHHRITLSYNLGQPDSQELDLLSLHDALSDLEKVDPQLAQVVEMRFFGGLSFVDIARAMNVSDRTIERYWRLARAWLHEKLGDHG